MVPFYGQGMNCGLEDVRLLFESLDTHNATSSSTTSSISEARAQALSAYTEHRTPDAAAITTLALSNYTEMRSSVRSPLYKARKWAEEHVNLWFPSLGWETQYARVSFENERYSEVEKAVEWQGKVLSGVVVGLGIGLVGTVGWGIKRVRW